MGKKLLIVESPAKAKTIGKYLGQDFVVKSSYGHIRDLEKGNDLGVDVENGYKPNYVIPPEKQKTVKELQEAARQSEEVWLATDEDREGEAISWHLCVVLGLDPLQAKRIVFHEITKPAIQQAVQSPRHINLNLVNAQQARRVLDRLVGWELSGLLWKKIKSQLSAGRVQSVAVKLIVEREREIQRFKPQPYFRLTANFLTPNAQGKMVSFTAESPERLTNATDAEDFLKKCIGAIYTVRHIDVRPSRRRPAPPFTTSTLQQEASRKLGFSVSRTMAVAQSLYEQGFITYMRTDSTSLSELALQAIGDQIIKQFGSRYHQLRRYKTKSAMAQEAHEAIRPTYIENPTAGSTRDEQRLYELIWKRTMACQMADAELEKTTVDIAISTHPDAQLIAEGEVLTFDGFLKLYIESTDEDEEQTQGILPPLKVGQVLTLEQLSAIERFTRPPARYTEASLVKKLEELGIGRPSTYAPTISKIMEPNRGYVVKDSRPGEVRHYQVLTLKNDIIQKTIEKEIVGATKNVLYPTDMGMIVSDFLDAHFQKIMDYNFTAQIEQQFDDIAEGKKEWTQTIDDFYRPFHEDVEKALRTAGRFSGERILGKDPKTGRTVLVRMSSLGRPVVQIGTSDELPQGEKPRYANLKAGITLETATLEEALASFDLPRSVGEYEGKEIILNTGRYGPYLRWGDLFVSLPKNEDLFNVTFERAIEYIQNKLAAEAPIGYYQNQPITKGKGRFGPFLKWADKYISIPSKIPFETITEKQAIELIEAKIEKEANRLIQRWPDENISIENGRWGPFIRAGKKIIKLPKVNGATMSVEQARTLTLEQVKALIAEATK
ncbi:MAG: type I DNA topoisomerase [Saprospiraceae bacterium]|nr:type I DNA topoisomerase [Saprospiraceae bacterium]MDW8483012.1 type I DNA topoisomerase [Saprospiraceae bacterium]